MSASGSARSDGEFLAGGLGEHEAAFLRLAALASLAHDQFAFRDEAAAARFYAELYARGGADFAPPSGRVLMVEGRPAGMFALVPPAVLRRSRLVGAMMLARSPQLRGDPGLVERLKLAAETFVRPEVTDGYLSRLAVDPAAVGRGIGRWLLDAALAATREHGLVRCVLEVAEENERAITLYRAGGFEEVGAARTRDPETGATLGYLHMAHAA